MFRKTTLTNGLRVITEKLESTKAVTVLVLAGAGSRYETKEINGISHFLEHMFFKGASKYKNAKEVSEAIDSVGGDFNAFTGKEYAGYYVKVSKDKVDVAFDVLSDMLLNSKFDYAEIEKERGVILEEYNMYQDTPMYQIGWNFERLVFGDQPLGRDEVGTKEFIKSVTHDDFVNYKSSLYVPTNIVLAVCGNIDHDEVVEKTSKFFALGEAAKAKNFEKYKKIKPKSRVYLTKKDTEQVHLACGVEAYSETHPDHFVLKVISVILGGNMSSRMFLNIREAHGLAYYIHTNTDDYMDTGLISTTAGVDVKRVYMAVEKIVEQYAKIAGVLGGGVGLGVSGSGSKLGVFDGGVAFGGDAKLEAELQKAKNFLKGKMVLRLEDSEEYAHMLGKYELLHKDPKTPEEFMREIDKVTVKDVLRVTADLFKAERLRLAVIGPFDDSWKFEELLKM